MTASRFRRFVRSAAVNGALMFVSLLLAVCAGEVAVRVAAPQQLIQIRPDLWQPADTVGWLRRPNVRASINTGERTVSVRTDSVGFRVGNAGRIEDGVRVLLLGDSFMEALQVDYEQSLAGVLQRRLPDAVGTQVAIRNAGVGGWGPSHYLLHARNLLSRDDYGLVIVAIYVGNDASPVRLDYVEPRTPAERHRFRFPRGIGREQLLNAFLLPVNDALEVRSHLFTLVKNRLREFRMRAGVSSMYLPPEFLKSEATSERWDIIGDISQDIAQLAAAHGARTLFVLVPASFQVDEVDFAQYIRGFGVDTTTVDLDQPTRLINERLTSRGLHVVDPLPAFRAADAAGTLLYGRVDTHLSPAGHDLLADLVLPAAARLIVEQVE